MTDFSALTRAAPAEAATALWSLLRQQAARRFDSSSLPTEQAQELLRSLAYTLAFEAEAERTSLPALLADDAEAALRRGQAQLSAQCSALRRVWEALCANAPPFENVYFTDTLHSLGGFFVRYDVYSAAHEIPCSIDYPLLYPIETELLGASFLAEYLRRLAMENHFLRGFDPSECRRLFAAVYPSWPRELMNLCEPPLTNALGRTLLGLDAHTLCLGPAEQTALRSLVQGKSISALDTMLNKALGTFPLSAQAHDYFRPALHSVAVRVNAAIQSGDLRHIFLAIGA